MFWRNGSSVEEARGGMVIALASDSGDTGALSSSATDSLHDPGQVTSYC